jgi:hypothetical protein
MQAAHDNLLRLFSRVEQIPSHYEICSLNDESASLKEYGTPGYYKRVSGGFGNVDITTLISAPRQTDAPFDDAVMYCAFSHPNGSDEAELTILMREDVWNRALEVRLIDDFLAISPWDYGYGLLAEKEADPYSHIACIGNGRQGSEESRRLDLWYGSSREDRLARLRDVYSYNFLNDGQLAFKFPDGRTLRDFIKQTPASRLKGMLGGLSLWEVTGKTEVIRENLIGTGVLITE